MARGGSLERELLLSASAVSKSYAGNPALIDVEFELRSGESVAIVGENGAGKSTFAKILTGAEQPDGGVIRVSGAAVRLGSPREALAQGIALIPQELAYVPGLTVAENLLLNRLPGPRGTTSPRAIRRHAAAMADRFQMEVPLDRRMSQISLADRQVVEILKALGRESKVLVLDEPTASLASEESRRLYELLGSLTARGIGVITISHRMDEVYAFFDRADVLRNGRLVHSGPPAELSRAQLVEHMLGRKGEELELATSATRGDAVLRLEGWRREATPALRGVDLELGRGELISIFGVRGCGADVIADGLAGKNPGVEGTLTVAGRKQAVFRSPAGARRARVGFIPPERKRDGLILEQSIEQNVALLVFGRLARFGAVRSRQVSRLAEKAMTDFDIRARSVRQPVGTLSGGNQQKVLLASRLAADPEVIILHEPTRGVDIGARLQIHRLLRTLVDKGKALMVVTTDVEEAVVLSDRLLVMRDGAIVDEMVGADKSQSRALESAAGAIT